MKADLIVKNARIYTVNSKQPWAEAIAVKDGKFVYVGSDKGIDAYESDSVIDADGQFIMPGLIDSHVHVGWSKINEGLFNAAFLFGDGKEAVLEDLKKFIRENPDNEDYFVFLGADNLKGEKLTRDELDAIEPTKELLIQEFECHSCWVNTPKLKALGIDEYQEDMSPGLSYFERDEDGRVNGRIFEFCHFTRNARDISVEEYEQGIDYLMSFWKKFGIVAGFDAGVPIESGEKKFMQAAYNKDKAGELPVYLDGCKYLYDPRQLDTAVEEINGFRNTYGTENFKPRIAKMMLDGTLIGTTAAIYEPYSGTDITGATLIDSERMYRFMLDLNENGIDYHVHTVGERAMGTVLDATEMARKELGDEFRIQVTVAHCETIPDEMLPRFAELGINVNFTPHWFGGNCIGSIDFMSDFIGEKRAHRMYRANSVWSTGANVTFACDTIAFSEDMKHWNPYMGWEVGMTRQDSSYETTLEDDFSDLPVYPSNEEKLSLSQMIKGYTLNAAKQMRLDDKVGSIEVGKDGSFLIFEQNLFDVDVYDIHRQLPKDVFFKGEKVN